MQKVENRNITTIKTKKIIEHETNVPETTSVVDRAYNGEPLGAGRDLNGCFTSYKEVKETDCVCSPMTVNTPFGSPSATVVKDTKWVPVGGGGKTGYKSLSGLYSDGQIVYGCG